MAKLDRSVSSRVFVIAEAGVNHNGDLRLARQLVDAASKAGADAVKFQSFIADRIASPAAGKAEYQKKNTKPSESQLSMLRRLELSPSDHRELIHCCRRRGIEFMSTPFDLESVELLGALGVRRFKIASGEITHVPLLRAIARKGRPIILSTGMSDLMEVERAVKILYAEGNRDVTLLHCVSEYPAPVGQINLRAMVTLRQRFGLPAGYSDHTPGAEVAVAAAALGASAIEKHLTLSRKMSGPDHAASLEPREFSEMVRQIRNVEAALGDGRKRPAPCEWSTRAVARRSLFAATNLPAGVRITEPMIECKRPYGQIPAEEFDAVIGKRLVRSLRAGQRLRWAALAPPSNARRGTR